MKKQWLSALLLIAALAMILLHAYVPVREEIRLSSPAKSSVPAKPDMPSGAVDINHADADALDALTGVGPSIAQRIVEERDTNGLFTYPEDLLSVRGIGVKTLKKLRDQIQINK